MTYLIRPMKSALSTILLMFSFVMANAAEDLSTTPVEKLIDGLAQIDSQAPGIHGTASMMGFIAENKPPRFSGGVLGSPAPKTPLQMRELARRGARVLPQLIRHLDDKRPTKLTIGAGKDFFFMFQYFSDEYDPKTRTKTQDPYVRGKLEKNFDGGYTVRIGDVCYAIIGQIVNRELLPVRYQPTAGLVINSPIVAHTLIKRVTHDWGGLDAAAHQASLIADAQSGDNIQDFGPAIVRLRFYYPEEFHRLKDGLLKKRIAEFELDERKQR